MEIRRYLMVVRRHLVLVIAIVAAALVAGWFITPSGHTYTATTTLYVGARSIDIAPSSGEVSADRVAGFDRYIATFAALAPTRPVAAAALDQTHLAHSPDQVVSETTAEQVTGTNLIQLSVTDRDPVTARVLANAVASSLVDQVRGVEPRGSRAETNQTLSVYEEAQQPAAPNSTGRIRNLALAGVFGLIAAGALLALLEHLDITLRSPEAVERQVELPVLGVVPAFRGPPIAAPVTVTDGVLTSDGPVGGGGSVA